VSPWVTAAAAERSDALIGAANEKSQMLMDCSKAGAHTRLLFSST